MNSAIGDVLERRRGGTVAEPPGRNVVPADDRWSDGSQFDTTQRWVMSPAVHLLHLVGRGA